MCRRLPFLHIFLIVSLPMLLPERLKFSGRNFKALHLSHYKSIRTSKGDQKSYNSIHLIN
jgi:hypothetical protein